LAIQNAEIAAANELKEKNEAAGRIAKADGNRKVTEIEAQQNYDKQVQEAKAIAEARRLQADADEAAIKKLIASFGGPENYLRWIEATRWNGQGPTTIIGGGNVQPVYPVGPQPNATPGR
jgi:regulator of protease activity HflC (stomatin/prohibitin superfamily)